MRLGRLLKGALFPLLAGNCLLKIDTALLTLSLSCPKGDGELVLPGRVVLLELAGQRVSITVDVDIPLRFSLDFHIYTEKRYCLGQEVMVHVPYSALLFTPLP